jgi:hypothetical protein
MGPREIGWGDIDWIHLAQGWRLVEGSCEHGNELSFYKMSENSSSSSVTGGFSRTQLLGSR